MGGIQDLPLELLELILKQVKTDDGERDASSLFALLCTNHQLHKLVLPLLYQELSPEQFQLKGPLKRTCAWAHTVLEDDFKASLVQEVHFRLPPEHSDIYHNDTGPPDQIPLPPYVLQDTASRNAQAILDIAFADAPDTKADWYKAIFDDHDIDRILVLSLFRLPALQNLKIAGRVESITERLKDLNTGFRRNFDPKGGTQLPFSRLESVWLSGGRNRGRAPTWPLVLMANPKQWPSIRKLECANTGKASEDSDATKPYTYSRILPLLVPKSSDLEWVVLHSSRLYWRHLSGIVGIAKALKRFEYSIGASWANAVITEKLVMNALVQQKDTLQVIKISNSSRFSEVDDGKSSAVSFREFAALRELVVNHRFFFGVGLEQTAEFWELKQHVLQALPPQLQQLAVVQCSENHIEGTVPALEALARERDTSVPALRKLSLEAGKDLELVKAHLNERIWFDAGMLIFGLGDNE